MKIIAVTLFAVAWPVLGAVDQMDSNRGGELFSRPGCVWCHNINGETGISWPRFDRDEMSNLIAYLNSVK